MRLVVLRDAYRGLIEAGLCSSDPTTGLRTQRQGSELILCPLTPKEVDRLQVGCRLRTSDTLRPAVVAAALAGASHAEIAQLMVSDADLDLRFLVLGSNRSRRTVFLDSASLTALRTQMAALRKAYRRAKTGWDPALAPLAMHKPVGAYRPQSVAPTVSMNLSRAMNRAGITRPGVRPRSVREYAANRVYAQTGRVEDVTPAAGLPFSGLRVPVHRLGMAAAVGRGDPRCPPNRWLTAVVKPRSRVVGVAPYTGGHHRSAPMWQALLCTPSLNVDNAPPPAAS
jgi:integrase